MYVSTVDSGIGLDHRSVDYEWKRTKVKAASLIKALRR